MAFIKQKNVGAFKLGVGKSGCCPDDAITICKHVFVITDLASIESITIDGNVHAIAATDETDIGDIISAIEAAFIAEGYMIAQDQSMIPNQIVYNELTTTAITIFTSAETVTLETTPVADDTYVSCIKTVSCRFHMEIPVGVAVDINISDADVEDANPADSPQQLAGTWATGAGDTLHTDLETALAALYANETNVTLKRIRVIEDGTTVGFYSVDFWLYGRRPIVTDDEDIVIVPCECIVDYTIAN